jgi:uncharacterized membrane protein YgcG
MIRPNHIHMRRYTFVAAIVALVLVVLLAACAGLQNSQGSAGTANQDPPVPQLTQATRGVVDTTGTVPQSFLQQLRSRSDEVLAHGFQIAVVIFNNLASDPHQLATRVFNDNGIGYKDTNNGVLFVLYLQKPGTDGHAPWLTYITGAGISGSLPDTLMDDYAQSAFVPARAQGRWQGGLLAFYDRVYAAEQDPTIAQQWQSQHPQAATGSGSPGTLLQVVGISVLVLLAIVLWLVTSAVVAARRGESFFSTAFRLLGRFLLVLALLSRGMGGGGSSRSRSGGSGMWGGGGRSPSSGGDV